MAEITCPMCGKQNPEDVDACQFCEARIKPVTDELSRAQPPIPPGEQPTEKVTAELEPVLPKWLRDARQEARDSTDDGEQALDEGETAGIDDSADLLAGLQSQSDDEEEVPDWLTDLRGEAPKPLEEKPSDEENDILPETEGMSGEKPPQALEVSPEAESLPGWISDLGATGEGEVVESQQTEDDSSEADQAEETEAASDPGLESFPDFSVDSSGEPGFSDQATADVSETVPSETSETPPPSASEGDVPDWLTSLDADSRDDEATVPAFVDPGLPADEGSETPDWLASLGDQEDDTIPTQVDGQQTVEGDIPDWLSSLEEEKSANIENTPVPPTVVGETPDSTVSSESKTPQVDQDSEPPESAAFTHDELEFTEDEGVTAAFVDDEGKPISTEDVDDLLSEDMPDWLSNAGSGQQQEEVSAGAAETPGDDLRPAELPSWVQAMRPVEAAISETGGMAGDEQPLEDKGPLAGLRGVLPAVQHGIVPSSKPKAYSLKLQASDEQQSNATMLERMLAAEIHPEPIATQPILLSQRILRWVITALLLLVTGGTIFSGVQVTPISPEVPIETSGAVDYLQEGLPLDASVLLIFDYEAAMAGELEATAAPFVDHMVVNKASRLSLISTKPTGPGLAERFMRLENTQSSIYYPEDQAGQQFINLGYLPGGAAGVLAFAQSENLSTIKPLAFNGEYAWTMPVLAKTEVKKISDFDAIILLTDDIDTARIWIEQTENTREDAKFIVISSARSGPMILPYVQSGQVDGMVTGLEGGAPIERVINGGRPGMARRYWDAYGFGLLVAVVMISLGSLWSLAAKWQAHRAGGDS